MHMKIATETSDGGTTRYILGQFSQPFTSIPHMIRHYTVSKLPVKGAEHICLLYPVSHELLWTSVIFVHENENGEKRENNEFVNKNENENEKIENEN